MEERIKQMVEEHDTKVRADERTKVVQLAKELFEDYIDERCVNKCRISPNLTCADCIVKRLQEGKR